MDDETRERALRRFRNMRGRDGMAVDFPTVGPPVQAGTPQELEQATADALSEAVEGEDPN
jgi:hypothetical protein